jgi:hypothetical protein
MTYHEGRFSQPLLAGAAVSLTKVPQMTETDQKSQGTTYASRKLHPAIFDPMQHCYILIAWFSAASASSS